MRADHMGWRRRLSTARGLYVRNDRAAGCRCQIGLCCIMKAAPVRGETFMDDRNMEALEAAAFRRLVAHLRERSDVQNIDMMIVAGFCRNCLGD